MLSYCHRYLHAIVLGQANFTLLGFNRASDSSPKLNDFNSLPTPTHRIFLSHTWYHLYTLPLLVPHFHFLEYMIPLISKGKRTQKKGTKGIRNKLRFCGRFAWSMMRDKESTCEGFIEGNKRVQYFIILSQTSVLSSGTGGSQGVTSLLRHFSHNKLYCCHSGNHLNYNIKQFTNKIFSY